MAGNFLKYGAAEATFGSMNAGDLPVDAHELIALCAPRPTFISLRRFPRRATPTGSTIRAATWPPSPRARSSACSARRISVSPMTTKSRRCRRSTSACSTANSPGASTTAGTPTEPNWKYFIPWANRMFAAETATAPARPKPAWHPADRLRGRMDTFSMAAHRDLLAKKDKGNIDLYFEGDSITRRWDATDYPQLIANWNENFHGWNAADFGWGADRVENILWRLHNGELDGVNPKVIVLLAGTNNVSGPQPPGGDAAQIEDISSGLEKVVGVLEEKAPNATIIVTAVFPRNDNMAYLPIINGINANLAKMADGKKVRFLNVNSKLADADGNLHDGMMNARDKLHPEIPGYQVWADGLKPMLTESLGPPKSEDHAPPPTGIPQVPRRARSAGR